MDQICLKTNQVHDCTHRECIDTWVQTLFDIHKDRMDELKKRQLRNTYFATFTIDPEKGKTESDLRSFLKKFVQRTKLSQWVATIEHMDTNLHAHVMFTYEGYFYKRYLQSYAKKFGIFQLDRVVRNNGIEKYITKLEEQRKVVLKNIEDI